MLAERKAGLYLALLPGVALQLLIFCLGCLILLAAVIDGRRLIGLFRPVQLRRQQLEQVSLSCMIHTFVS